MEETPTFRPYLFATLFLSLGGAGGLALLLAFTTPTIWPRWGLFALTALTLIGLALPLSYFFNTRFAPGVSARVIVREALWVGVYGAFLLWLQTGRVLSFPAALWLAIGAVMIEFFLRWRETLPPAEKP
ncbi:MAG: hypothetical protein OHK0031_02260 [Anaerolineales bacterium]